MPLPEIAWRPRSGGLIARILPSAAVTAESHGPLPETGQGLFPAEERAIRTAGPRRRAEFIAGRLCARTALARLGVPGGPVLPGPAGQPQWPAGVTGSITHCPGYRACAVARTADVTAIGIDAEPDEELPGGLIETLAAGPEQALIRRQAAAMPTVRWERLIFSAKEAAGKLWYPLTGQWPDWPDLVVSAATAGTFTVRLPEAGPGLPSTMTGRWLVRDGLIITAIAWTRPAYCLGSYRAA
jgi:4'-phosphopantetheinyl transferase EntD